MGANKGGIATVLEIPQTSSISFDVVDTTVGPYLDGGAFSSIAPWVKSTSLTGTWDYQIWGDLAKTDKIAEFLNRTTAGFNFVPLTAPYNSTRVAIPRPRVYSFINTVAGSLTISRIYFAHI